MPRTRIWGVRQLDRELTMRNRGGSLFQYCRPGGSVRHRCRLDGCVRCRARSSRTGGTVDISGLSNPGMTAGSIAGAGDYYLGSKNLRVGGNNTDTIVSGGIHDGTSPINGFHPGGPNSGGSLTKVGTGILTIIPPATPVANIYTGGTTLDEGILEIGSLNPDSPSNTPLGGATSRSMEASFAPRA
jgi:hypothetical protein